MGFGARIREKLEANVDFLIGEALLFHDEGNIVKS
jgi:hypothetical protein